MCLVSRDGSADYMRAGDALDGEKGLDKMNSFIHKSDELSAAKDLLANTQKANVALKAAARYRKQEIEDKRIDTNAEYIRADSVLTINDAVKAFMESQEFRMNKKNASIVIDDFKLNAITVDSVDLSPSDRVVPALTPLLDPMSYLPQINEAGDVFNFFRMPIFLPPATGSVQPRGSLDTMNDNARQATRHQVVKQRIGGLHLMDRTYNLDSPSLYNRSLEMAIEDARRQILYQTLVGASTGNTWDGIMATAGENVLSGANTVAGTSANNVYDGIRLEIVKLIDRGARPNAIFISRTEWNRVYNYLISLNFATNDFDRFPMGSIIGIPLVIAQDLPATEALVGEFSMNTLSIVMSPDATLETSTESNFDQDAVAIKVTARGNVAILRPDAFIKITAVNSYDDGIA